MTDEQYTKAVDAGTYANFVNDSAGYRPRPVDILEPQRSAA